MTHAANIVIHVVFGTIALVIGFVPLVTPKGGRSHVRFGRWFLICLIVVIATAVIGIVAFGFRAFLGVITMLAAYEAWSGYRVFSIRATGPRILDAVVSLTALGAAVLFVMYLRSVQVCGGFLRSAPLRVAEALGRAKLALRTPRQDDWRVHRDRIGVFRNGPRAVAALQPDGAVDCRNGGDDRLHHLPRYVRK